MFTNANKDEAQNAVRNVLVTIGARNVANEERQQEDYYATEPKALELLLEKEKFSPNIWECACGEGHLSKVLIKEGYNVFSSDLYDRGYGEAQIDFLETTFPFL